MSVDILENIVSDGGQVGGLVPQSDRVVDALQHASQLTQVDLGGLRLEGERRHHAGVISLKILCYMCTEH